ncbi:DUF3307 domain-containing protein [Halocella sp. SP3-1]|uniref:DUF3307 domain-containing protein n=1 Tax=Halocella sp. SP3-1 TaxID=2382161 RepID=UPI000F765A60|nr:DUF3307 domain-containing protein [Halocella sp. SP3-1]AZO95270.1 DUF3307 domain-containing protein [Halocella sp. SP3-1]
MNIILGHMIGDYLFQSDWMAINKKKSGLAGLIPCIVHCLIWTISVFLFIGEYRLIFFCMLFLSHFILDRTNFVKWYLKRFKIMPNPTFWKIVIVDNTLHLLMIFLVLKVV